MYSMFLSNILLSNSELSQSDNFKCLSAKCHRRYHICHVLECVGDAFSIFKSNMYLWSFNIACYQLCY